MEKTFQTGSFSFRLKFPEELVLPVDMEKFLVKTDSADYTYIITAVDILPEAEGELIVDRVDLQVFHTKEGLESRRIGVKGEARPYAFYRETAQNRAEVFVGRWYLAEVEKYEVVFLSLLALERRLAEQPCLCTVHTRSIRGKQCSFLHRRERAKPRRRDSGNSTGEAVP